MKYQDSENEIQVGDKVKYAGTPGVIIFVIDDDSYSETYPKEDWSSLGTGFGLKLEDGNLIHFDSADDEEDLEFVSRATE